jgi:hypothetical protein
MPMNGEQGDRTWRGARTASAAHRRGAKAMTAEFASGTLPATGAMPVPDLGAAAVEYQRSRTATRRVSSAPLSHRLFRAVASSWMVA